MLCPILSETKLDVRAYPIKEPKGKTVAFASVTINDMIGINGIQVVDAYHAEIDKQSVKEQLKGGQKADKATLTPSTTKEKGTKAKTTKKTSEPEH